MTMKRFAHNDPTADEMVLAREADDFLTMQPKLQFVVELLTILRELKLPWWTPTKRRQAYPVGVRMQDLKERNAVGARIIHELAGTRPKAAEKLARQPVDAAKHLELVLEDDVSDEEFENAFQPVELVLYGDAARFYADFRGAMPWEECSEAHKKLVAQLIDAFLKPRDELGNPKTKELQPILTPNQVLSAIQRQVWQKRIKPDVLEAVDALLLEKERENPGGPFPYGKYVMGIATSEVITRDIDLSDLIGIFEAAEKAMGFEPLEALEEDDTTRSAPEGEGTETDPMSLAKGQDPKA